MPTSFIWVPCSDPELEAFAVRQCQGKAVKYLKRPTETIKKRDFLLGPHRAAWKDVANGDRLMICGHGFATSTDKIGWIGTYPHADVVTWTSEELARAVGGLATTNGLATLDITLCMCWGADKLGGSSFAGRLASTLSKHRLRGGVDAYLGKMVINPFSAEIVVNGTGRWASARNEKYDGKPGKLVANVAAGSVPGHAFAKDVTATCEIPLKYLVP